MDIAPFPRRRHWWLLGAGLLFLYVFALGTRGLNEPDEGRYADIGLAMAKTGDWWEPRISGFGHYDKPPLTYWVTALSLRALGTNEWAARLPSLLGAMLGLLGLGGAAARLYGPRVAWWAVLICGTSVQFWALGRILSPDMLMTGWCTLAIAAWAECRASMAPAPRVRHGAWGFWWLSLVFWTLAWWTKATPALIPLAGLTIGLALTQDAPGLRALRLWLLVPGILLLGSPWFLSMLHLHPELKHFFFGRELAARMAGSVDGRHGSKLYYLAVSLVGWLPWWPIAAWTWWRERRSPAQATEPVSTVPWARRLGLEGWIVLAGLVIFSLAASKLPTYTLPLAPWAALLMARSIARYQHRNEQSVARPRWLMWPAGAFAFVAVLLSLLAPRYESSFGVNSSVREVCRFLAAQPVRNADFDHYWAGAEFYLDPGVIRYVILHDRQQERPSDPGLYPGLFIGPDAWLDLRLGGVRPAGEPFQERWLVRFSRQKGTAFEAIFESMKRSGERARIIHIGNFELMRPRAALAATGKTAGLGEDTNTP